MFSKSEFYSSGWVLILRRGAKDLLLNSDIVNFLLKAKEGRDRRPNFLFCTTLIFGVREVRWEGGKSVRMVRW